jgi:hypothetical protein
MMEDTVICYEERVQAQRRDLNVQVQELAYTRPRLEGKLDTQGQQSMASMQRQEDWMARLEQAIANIANNQSHR